MSALHMVRKVIIIFVVFAIKDLIQQQQNLKKSIQYYRRHIQL